ncbi:176_t:CDS:1, partial [Racocetra persica]
AKDFTNVRMAKYLLNIRQSGKSDDMEGNIVYKFDLETPLRFPFSIDGENYVCSEYKRLEIKTSQNESEFFRDGETDR